MTEPQPQTDYDEALALRQLIANEVNAQVQAAIAAIQQETFNQADAIKAYVQRLVGEIRNSADSEIASIRSNADSERAGISKLSNAGFEELQIAIDRALITFQNLKKG